MHYEILSGQTKKGNKKAGDGNRTHISSLEGWCSTTELHPRILPGSGIEPETRGFSVLCSTNWANQACDTSYLDARTILHYFILKVKQIFYKIFRPLAVPFALEPYKIISFAPNFLQSFTTSSITYSAFIKTTYLQ